MRLGRLTVTASRWPWQGYGWRPHKAKSSPSTALLNPTGSRFGGGWNYRLGISVSDRTVLVDLLFGTLRFSLEGSK